MTPKEAAGREALDTQEAAAAAEGFNRLDKRADNECKCTVLMA